MLGRSGSSVRTTLGMLLLGDYGTWKSSIALESLKLQIPEVANNENVLRNSRVLFIDIENGSVDSYLEDYEEQGYNLNNIYVVYTQSLSDIKTLIERAKDGDDFYVFDEETQEETNVVALDGDGKPFRPDIIVIDGMALLYHAREQQYLKFSEKRAMVKTLDDKDASSMKKQVAIEGADLEFKEYKKLQFDGNDLISDLIGSGKHWVVTCFAKDEQKDELGMNGKPLKNKMGQVQKIRTGNYIPEGFKDLVKYCKTVMYLYEDEDDTEIKGLIQRKDRTKMFQQGEVIVNPSLTMWQPILVKNLDKELLVVKNNLIKDVNRDLEKELLTVSQDDKKEVETKTVLNSDPAYYHEIISTKMASTQKGSVARKELISKLSKFGIKGTTLTTITDIELLKNAVEAIQ